MAVVNSSLAAGPVVKLDRRRVRRVPGFAQTLPMVNAATGLKKPTAKLLIRTA